ncbi:MAG: hypothetical protein HYZ26_08835 [Chloroflexi bacterium]|nr:hypothetical protein [Chloroflexota bacterium]
MTHMRFRFPLLAGSILLLLAALWAGLLRLGWAFPPLAASLPMAHGPLMISGFLGTLIGIERAVALGRRWMYLGPAFTVLGGALLAAGNAQLWGAVLILAGSLLLNLVFIGILRRVWSSYTIVMGLGALSWLAGNIIWLLGRPVSTVVYWWAGFLVLTIAGERLELGRVMRLDGAARATFLLSVGAILAGQAAGLFAPDTGTRLFGLGLVGLSLWLLRYDVARKTLAMQGLPRFIAICLLGGYFWLAFSGLVAVGWGYQAAGFLYDAFLHALFVGFLMSMIFGHGPIIFPAVLARTASYHPILYLPLALLHASLAARLLADVAGIYPLRLWGGMFNAIAILLYLPMMAGLQLKAKPVVP